MNARVFYAALLTPTLLLGAARGHGVPLLLTTTDGGQQLATQGLLPIGQFENDGSEIYAEDPGFGVGFAATGPPVGTSLELQTTGGLLFWDGAAIVASTATLTIEAPDLGSPVDEYPVGSATPPLGGMTLATYPGGDNWDVHGYYTLSAGAPLGVYGVPLRVASPTLAATDPFLLLFTYQAGAAWDPLDGVAALREAFAAPLAGDYDGDGGVDAADHAAWAAAYGQPVASPGLGADGNGDGLVTAADYTVWRDAAASSPVAAVPEPAAAAVAAAALVLLLARRPCGVFTLETIR